MANRIKLRRGSTAPTAGSFLEGEPAWDSTNKKLYVKAADGSMAEIGAGGGSSTLAGLTDVNLSIPLNEGDILYYSAGISSWQNVPGTLYSPGFVYAYSNDVTATDPGAGFFKFNSLTTSSITTFYISKTDVTATDRSGPLLFLDDSNNAQRATIFIPGAATGFQVSFVVTGTITDNGTWLSIPVTWTSGALPTAGTYRAVLGVRNGNDASGGALLSAANAFTGANTFYNDIGQTFGTSNSANDGIVLDGRSGGTGSFRVTLTPNTLTASRTMTLADGDVTLSAGTTAVLGTAQTFTAAQTFRAANSVRAEAAATQDAVVLAGRTGGTGSFAVTLTPTTLTASRTVTLPNGNVTLTAGTSAVTGTAQSWSANQTNSSSWLANGTTSGIGYSTGAGGTVTQLTSRTTGVTLNRPTGAITLFSTTTTAGQTDVFTVTNSSIAATDVIVLNHDSGGTFGQYWLQACNIATGSFQIAVYTPAAQGTAAAPVISYVVIKGVTA